MKTSNKIIALFLVLSTGNYGFSQQGESFNINNISTQQPRNSFNAITYVNGNTKIHANSNSVFLNVNTSSNYNKKDPRKKEEIKNEADTKNNKVKKSKK